MATLDWPFRITVDEDGTHRVSPIGFPNCEGIGPDIEAARKAGSTALSFAFDSGIAEMPKGFTRLPITSDGLEDDSITKIRIDLRG